MILDIVNLLWYHLREAKKRLEWRVGAKMFRALLAISDICWKDFDAHLGRLTDSDLIDLILIAIAIFEHTRAKSWIEVTNDGNRGIDLFLYRISC